jgi:galactokinase
MTGAGFGGSAIALVRTEGIQHFIDQVRQMYAKCSEHEGSFFHGSAVDGVSVRAMT